MFILISFTFLLCINLIATNDDDNYEASLLLSNYESLLMSSFEAYRRLIRDSGEIQEFLRERLCLPEKLRVERLDPLVLSDKIIREHPDPENNELGKIVITVDDIKFFGISAFQVESISNVNGSLNFIHRVPKIVTTANYSVDYELFNQLPFRISEGSLKTNIVDAHINGTFRMYPDTAHSWFKVSRLNVTTACTEPLDILVEPKFIKSDRFVINSSTLADFSQIIRSVLPKVAEILKLTYSKAIELKTL